MRQHAGSFHRVKNRMLTHGGSVTRSVQLGGAKRYEVPKVDLKIKGL
jgi:hypothetical protein